MLGKLKANQIIPRNVPVAFVREGRRWVAVHAITKASLGVWSDETMISLIAPGQLRKDSLGRVSRKEK